MKNNYYPGKQAEMWYTLAGAEKKQQHRNIQDLMDHDAKIAFTIILFSEV